MKETIYFEVKGINHRPQKTLTYIDREVVVGDSLTLEPEPRNPYDKNAVKVYHDFEWIGYVELSFAEEVSNLLKDKVDVECKVLTVDVDTYIDITDSGSDVERISNVDLIAELTYKVED